MSDNLAAHMTLYWAALYTGHVYVEHDERAKTREHDEYVHIYAVPSIGLSHRSKRKCLDRCKRDITLSQASISV